LQGYIVSVLNRDTQLWNSVATFCRSLEAIFFAMYVGMSWLPRVSGTITDNISGCGVSIV